MKIDTSAWKINDPAWVKKREEDWPLFESWLRDWYSPREGRLVEPSIVNAKKFYMIGVLDKDIEARLPEGVTYDASLILHPNITAKVVRELINFYSIHGKRSDLKGYFRHYFLLRSRYLNLINAGVLSEHFMLALLEGAYGHSMDEAAEILGFKVEDQYYNVVYNLGPILYLYYFSDNNDKLTYHTANLLLPHYIESLTHINDKEAEDCDFIFAQHVKRKKKYFDSNLVTDPERVDFMKRLLKEIHERWSDITPVAQEKLKGLFE